MSVSVNQLIQNACELCSIVGNGQSVAGNTSASALTQLNILISELNSQDFIASSQNYVDVSAGDCIHIFKLENSEVSGLPMIDMEAPEKIAGVSRILGSRWLPLAPCDIQQIYSRTRMSLPTSWSYDRKLETSPSGKQRFVGKITLDGTHANKIRVWYNEPIKQYRLTDTIYLSDLYNNLLLQGLCTKLCILFKLTDYLPMFNEQFLQAKNLIKRNTATQRMLQRGELQGGYNDSYYNGIAGSGW